MVDAFVNDDWRIGPSLTLNLGVRWDYGSPITEKYNRLVNLDVTPGFTAISPVVANENLTGSLTHETYPDSLIRPDRKEFQPILGFAWRPIPASSIVVRGGYSLRYNTSIYQQIATQMAQQSPLSTSLQVQNQNVQTDTPLNTLRNGFNGPPGLTTNNFAVDPNFRVGYAQNWYTSIQKDLPGSLIMTVDYYGTKGTRIAQEFYPNTYPIGVTNPCASCPSGYIYETSNGNSTREAGQLQLRRRLHNGFTAQLQYTYAKAIDDSNAGGRGVSSLVAQNWLDLSAERGLSATDQRHLLNFTGQYTTGQGIGGGSFAQRLARHALQRVDRGFFGQRRHWYASDADLCGNRARHRIQWHPAQLHRPRCLQRSARAIPESLGLYRSTHGCMGDCGTEFHHRTHGVQHERVVLAHVPAERSLQPRSAHRFRQPHQPRYLHELEHHHQQSAVRDCSSGQRYA